ncbi:CusA/CzcA family heavy metal efflux RND transporter [Chitinophagaceae bacterium LWZ2-11]
MLNAIIRFSVKNKPVIGLFIVALIAWGSYSVTQLPIDAVPDITNNQVLIITSAPSLGAPDVERFITVPLEQATRNIPDIVEQRSFSRFGLSLVTIVFDDDIDVYKARQLVSERLTDARQQIPAGIGDPQLGPVTTGLGEIFQYVVKAKKGYEGKYGLTDLRDIQDWVVRKQLLGTPGVADVSSLGGAVKQYEVAVVPEKLKSFGLTINDVFKSLENNNQNTGGAYIEKGPNVLFIRTEGLVNSLDDIRNVVVKQVNDGAPVLINDVAAVKFGTAVRYGATLFNDEGEVAGAVVMMLKGQNSNVVIQNIKAKIKEIEKTLPEGVMIEPFLDRSKMVKNAISTVERNLIEGALIVVFVLVFFLANLRAGLIVASVIPLSMLFAIIMMNLFGVSGNLMSLGAVDFGLLVDGAVIIVEIVMHTLAQGQAFKSMQRISQKQMDGHVEEAAGKMMNSAVFGQIIILVVYLPILSLQGIEGKMFKPMAQTVSFAVIGAFLLSLTYIPMMSALCLSKKINHKETYADKFIIKLQRIYTPLLQRVLRIPRIVIGSAFILFAIAVIILTRMGGEFIPQLEEGDFAIDTRLLTGASLTTTVETTQKSAKVLLDKFPEVEKIVTKIGSGEIPTDPMPIEAADMMVILKPKKEWKSAKSFPELADKMSDALQEVPGISVGFQFPVQMRFNELMTGARQDVVCKIFGDNLDTLAYYANRLTNIIQSVKGAKDLYTETVTGIPQLIINYNRAAIAKYGANIKDINTTIQAAYAGSSTGLVFEGERRYDLVVRMNETQKKDVNEVGNLLIGLPTGNQVPLSVLADVQIKDGPYQIQREDAARRISVGFNVRNRDVQSIVTELQEKIDAQIKLPPGYHIKYGGQYENLQNASKRLSIVVPIALLLIFIILFFAFKKLSYCVLIFSAIPLSAIGGVFALSMRGMPFSISAGVGFIALFGVAVLNGIVLISEMNRLKKTGITNINQIIMEATQTRLRPVLMTASVAALGFLPMALSNGAGAEVQRPLATVVIGGLFTATLLTLLVLPSLYAVIEKREQRKKIPAVMILLLLSCSPFITQAQQTKKLTMQQAVEIAQQQNKQIRISKLQEKYYGALKQATADLPKTQFTTELGNINSASFDNKFSISQSFSMPGVYKKQRSVFEKELSAAEAQTGLRKTEITRLTKLVYLQLEFIQAKKDLLEQTDKIFSNYLQIAELRFKKGESNLLEKVTLDNQVRQVRMQLEMLQSDNETSLLQLGVLLNDESKIQIADTLDNGAMLFDTTVLDRHPYLKYYIQQQEVAGSNAALEKARLSPDWLLGYSNQSFVGWQSDKNQNETYYSSSSRFSMVQLGIAVPLFNKVQKAKAKAAEQNIEVASAITDQAKTELKLKLQENLNAYYKFQSAIQYYKTNALPQAALIIKTANLSYKNGEINYIECGTLLSNAISLQNQYVDALKELNMHKIELEYLLQPNQP